MVSALYDRWSESYDDDPNRTRDAAARAIREAPLAAAGGDVVELGCGTGANTAWLSERARRVVAVDFSAGMLRRARASAWAPGVHFVRHDIRMGLPFTDGAADLVVIVLVLEHVERLEPVFAECARVLKGGGELFVCEYHPQRQLGGGQARFRREGTGEEVRIPAFVHQRAEFVDGGARAGLRVLHMTDECDERDPPGAPPRALSLHFRKS